MSEFAQLLEMMQKQMEKQEERHLQQMEVLLKRLETGGPAPVTPAASVPSSLLSILLRNFGGIIWPDFTRSSELTPFQRRR